MTESNWSLLNSILNVCFYWLCSFLNLILLVLAMLYLHKDRDLKSYHLITSGKSNFQRKIHLPLNKWFPSYCNFYLLGVGYRVTIFVNFVYKWICKFCLQMNPTVIFGILQNNAGLVYIFGTLFNWWFKFHYSRALLFLKLGYQKNSYPSLKPWILVKIRKRSKVCSFKVIFRKNLY